MEQTTAAESTARPVSAQCLPSSLLYRAQPTIQRDIPGALTNNEPISSNVLFGPGTAIPQSVPGPGRDTQIVNGKLLTTTANRELEPVKAH